MEGMTTASWNKARLARFENSYNAARARNADAFEFDGHEFITSYAKYLIRYLHDEFAKHERNGQP
jgi:hypothetical protein